MLNIWGRYIHYIKKLNQNAFMIRDDKLYWSCLRLWWGVKQWVSVVSVVLIIKVKSE